MIDIRRLGSLILVGVVLACAGTACRDKDNGKTTVVFTRSVPGSFYFQPEDSIGFNKLQADSLGKYVYELDLKKPVYYCYVDANMHYHAVYVTPGQHMEIIETPDSVFFEGDGKAENSFINRNVLLGNFRSDVARYSADWLNAFEQELMQNLELLKHSGLSPEFIRQHSLYYRFVFYRQLLGVSTMQMFSPMKLDLPDNFYDFLKQVRFDDPWILYVPKWFPIMKDAFERMEKEGMIEISPENYMRIYASGIQNEQLRSAFLVGLLNFTLDKGYSDDIPVYVESVRPLVTDSVALAGLAAFEKRYQESCEVNKSIRRGMVAPVFEARDRNGKLYNSADWKGKVVVLDFWFTGCIPCRAEIPYMDKLAEEMKGEPIRFISLSLDSGDELTALWKKMVKDQHGPVLPLNVAGGFKSDLAKAYQIHGVPRIVIIDKEGRIVDACAKRPSDPKLKMQLEQLVRL